METILKPCPFCGARLNYKEGSNLYEHPRNRCFLARIDRDFGQLWFRKDTANVLGWNTRAEDYEDDMR